MTDQLSGDPTITPEGAVVVGADYTPDHLDPGDPSTVTATDDPVPSVQITPEPIAWLTLRIRQAIYAALAGALAVLVILGRITADQSVAVLPAADAALNLATAVALIVAARHITTDSWSTFRLALYSLASAVLVALGAFGIVVPSTMLDVLNQVLNAAGAVLMVLALSKMPPAIEAQG